MSKNRIADALGASRTQTLSAHSAQGPLGLLQLRAEVAHRLQSTGGRPTDPDWSMRRVVPFKPDKWAELETIARRLSAGGRTVSPAQLAAILIERGLARVDFDDDDILDALEPPDQRAS